MANRLGRVEKIILECCRQLAEEPPLNHKYHCGFRCNGKRYLGGYRGNTYVRLRNIPDHVVDLKEAWPLLMDQNNCPSDSAVTRAIRNLIKKKIIRPEKLIPTVRNIRFISLTNQSERIKYEYD